MTGPRNRLELTWYNKGQSLIQSDEGIYDYQWADPAHPRASEIRPLIITGTVTGQVAEKDPDILYSERADLTPTTDNLLINGESGVVLNSLCRVPELADKYLGQVQLVYIDPPFNTEETFDHYEDNLENSIWLTLMRERLMRIKDLLSDTGSIWVHLNDDQNHRMRCLLDEVFGAGNFVAEAVWKRKRKRSFLSSKRIVAMHDMITIYAKNTQKVKMTGEVITTDGTYPLIRRGNASRTFTFPAGSVKFLKDEDRAAGVYEAAAPIHLHDDVCVVDGVNAESFQVTSQWGMTEETLLSRMASGAVPMVRGSGMNFRMAETRVVDKSYGSLLPDLGTNETARSEIEALFPGVNPFSTPKPERLLEWVIATGSAPGDIVVDVFAGSGTTAAVAHKMGRRWVTCELLESNFSEFVVPRLTKVVEGSDPGGVSWSAGERVPVGMLPERVSAQEASEFSRLLGKFSAVAGVGKSTDVEAIKSTAKTTITPRTCHWRGGGSFTTAITAPPMFDHHEGITYLTDNAEGEPLINSVAANLGYTRINHPIYHGIKGRMLLLVLNRTITIPRIQDALAHLPDNHKLIIAGIGIMEGTRQYLRENSRGSVIKHLPDDLFNHHKTTSGAL